GAGGGGGGGGGSAPRGGVFAVLGVALFEPGAGPGGRVPTLAVSAADPLPLPAGGPRVPEGCRRNGCWAWAGWNDRRPMRGAGARLSIHAPAVSGPGHSLADVALQWGDDGQEILEAGWEVAPARYHDGAPHLFVQRWVRG